MDTIEIVWKMELGEPGRDACTSTPLRRALNQLAEEGKPFSNFVMCFFTDETKLLRWFGVFVASAGDRVIFFPGFVDSHNGIEGHKGNSLRWQQGFKFDHATLEKDRRSWHLTSRDSADHLGGPRTLPLGEGRFLWMGISIADASVLRLLNQETLIQFSCPAGDGQRRREVFRNAREGAKFPIVSLNEDGSNMGVETFLHFGLIVGPKGFAYYSGAELGFPIGSPYLDTPLPQVLTGIACRSHRLELSAETDLQITVCRLPGRLKVPFTITSPSEPCAVAI